MQLCGGDPAAAGGAERPGMRVLPGASRPGYRGGRHGHPPVHQAAPVAHFP